MLSAAGLNCIIEGDKDGVVLAQSIQNGESVEMGTVVTVTCGTPEAAAGPPAGEVTG